MGQDNPNIIGWDHPTIWNIGSGEIGYICHGVLFFGLGYNQSSGLVSISGIWHQVT